MADNNNENNSQQQQQPGLIGSHLQYAKGATEAVIGGITGSHAWKSSGEQDKAASVSAMRKASEQRDPTQGYGKVEQVAGNLTGCEGMQKEGAASIKKD